MMASLALYNRLALDLFSLTSRYAISCLFIESKIIWEVNKKMFNCSHSYQKRFQDLMLIVGNESRLKVPRSYKQEAQQQQTI